jgi:allantoate deiminase
MHPSFRAIMALHSGENVNGAIDARRVLERIDALASCSAEDGALTRVFLSPQHRAANKLVAGWMREAGLEARGDAIGNVIGRYEGEQPGLPCLMLGSHLDTVRNAGKFDGMLGVITAIECVAALNRTGTRLPFAIEVVGFADEEGVRFQSTLLGSRAVAGTFDQNVLTAVDADGVPMAEALRAFGLDPARIHEAARRHEDVLAYVELHIEQGPVLEREGLPVGIVTAINGAARFMIDIIGEAGHAGTVPMAGRRDALPAAAEAVLAIERICRGQPDLVGTVGRISALPGALNVIPGAAQFSIDVRSPIDQERADAERAIESAIDGICALRGLQPRITRLHASRATPCADWLMTQLATAITARGIRVRKLASGAGHDATAMRDLTDVAMLFIPCAGGISHNPREAANADDIAVGGEVLLQFIRDFRPNRAPPA